MCCKHGCVHMIYMCGCRVCMYISMHVCIIIALAVCIRDACICMCAVYYVRTVHGMCLSNA